MQNAWPQVPLGRVVKPIERSEVPVPGRTYRQIGVRLWGEGAYEREPVDGGETRYARLSRVEAGDIIVNKIWARNGSVAIVPPALAGCYGSAEFPTFAPLRDRLDPRWFHWLTKIPGFWKQCDQKSRGTSGKNRIRPERFLEIEIPLPPLGEQGRIAARIEELAGKIEEACGLQRTAAEEADALRDAASTAILRQEANARPTPIGDFAHVCSGIQKSPGREPATHPVRYLTVAHVQRNRISLSDPRFFEVSPTELHRWLLRAGDVLIIEGNGSVDQIGRTALFRGEIEPCVHQNHVIRIRADPRRADPEFLNAFLNSRMGQDEVQARSRTTSGLRNLSVGRIKEITVPLPVLRDQRRIVAYLDELQAKADTLKRLQADMATELGVLLPSVLHRAFRGEL